MSISTAYKPKPKPKNQSHKAQSKAKPKPSHTQTHTHTHGAHAAHAETARSSCKDEIRKTLDTNLVACCPFACLRRCSVDSFCISLSAPIRRERHRRRRRRRRSWSRSWSPRCKVKVFTTAQKKLLKKRLQVGSLFGPNVSCLSCCSEFTILIS